MVRIYPTDGDLPAESNQRPSPKEVEKRLMKKVSLLVRFARDARAGEREVTLGEFEKAIIPRVLELGCLVVALFLSCCEERLREQTPTRLSSKGRHFQRRAAKDREITCWFGPIRYWRTYMAETGVKKGKGHGFYPLDHLLGLTKERFSFSVLNVVVRLASMLSFATAKSTAELFMLDVPSTEVIEQATLGFGRFTGEWFEREQPKDGDGDVLVILFDGKGTPQATNKELEKRRQPWKDRPRAASPRQRGRKKRDRRTKKKRRAQGDKSKNARMATMVVMYTLRTVGTELYGPINKWHYASFAPKKHAFAIALREAVKRGFDPKGDDVIQIVTDGDDDLALYTKLFFPNAIHTLDIMHVIERLWKASKDLFEAGSEEGEKWVEEQKDLLYSGEIKKLVRELRAQRRKICRSKKNEKRLERLKDHIDYLHKRVAMMNYSELIDEDLEIGSGAVEGAVKHVIAKRCDQGGMRWIVERNEAVVQLRCIEVNGDWDRFTEFVHDRIRQEQIEDSSPSRIQQKIPEPLPDMLEPPELKEAA